MLPPLRQVVWVSSGRTRTSLVHPRGLLPVTPGREIAQLPQVKMRLPEPHVNGRFDGRDEICISTGHAKSAEKCTEYGAVTLRLATLRQHQARLDTLLSCGDSHGTPSFNTAPFYYHRRHRAASVMYRFFHGET